MARGHRRLSLHRPNPKKAARRKFAVVANETAAVPVRSLAVRALAWTGAAVSVLTPAHAVTLGEIAVESALGQPLTARIPVDLGTGESIGAACVSAPSAGSADLGSLPQPALSVPETKVPGTYDVRVTTTQPLYEPMYELQLQVRCTGTPLLVRHYVLMLDLPAAEPRTAAPPAIHPAGSTPAPATRDSSTNSTAPQAPVSQRPPHPRHPVTLGAPIAPGSRYRVAAGDTLSTIAARLSDRGGRGIWRLADEIFASNPNAFIGGNQDLIKLGSEITLPSAGSASAAAPASAAAAPAPPGPSIPAMPAMVAPAGSAEPVAPAQPSGTTVLAPQAAAAAAEPEVVTGAAPGSSVQAAAGEEPAAPVAPSAVFRDEQGSGATASAPAAATRPEPTSGRAPDHGAPPWLAALVGLLIGAVASVVLLRERLQEALRGLLARKTPVPAPFVDVETASRPSPTVSPPSDKPMRPRESSMVVVEERHQDADEAPDARIDQTDRTPALAPAAPQLFSDTGLHSELSTLFGDESELQSLQSADGGILPSGDELDLDLSAATRDVTVDQDIGWIGDETALTPTQQSDALTGTGGDTVQHVDLQTLSVKATDDAQLSQTLKDALNLLESDYEDELTASVVVDRTKVREAPDDGDQDDTMVRTGTDHIPRR